MRQKETIFIVYLKRVEFILVISEFLNRCRAGKFQNLFIFQIIYLHSDEFFLFNHFVAISEFKTVLFYFNKFLSKLKVLNFSVLTCIFPGRILVSSHVFMFKLPGSSI